MVTEKKALSGSTLARISLDKWIMVKFPFNQSILDLSKNEDCLQWQHENYELFEKKLIVNAREPQYLKPDANKSDHAMKKNT